MTFDEFKKRIDALVYKNGIKSQVSYQCNGQDYFARIPGIVKIYGKQRTDVCTYRWGAGHMTTGLLPSA